MARVVHFEVHAENPDRAIEFYRSALGWQFQKWDGPADYWMITTGEKDEPGINGGLVRRKGEIDGQAVIAFVCTVDVSNVDDAVARIQKHGGSVVVPKMAVPGVGWLVYFKDTEGNILGAMQADAGAA
ncbi:MAG: glyoxalase [Phycisphaerae bacterium SG8_4]|nr:MAG: glyoxalase [Phycisphaerae bacterium SG8_4]